MKVCILTSAHSPFDVRIFHKEVRSLVRAGYDVTIIAQHDKEEVVDGVKIINLQKSLNRIERMTKTVWSAFRKALEVDADIYHFHDPELIPLGFILKLLGHKVIYDIHEDVPRQVLSKKHLPLIMRKPISCMMSTIEWIGAKTFDGIVPATPKIAKRFPKNKTITVQNFPIISEMSPKSPVPYADRTPSFAYPGSIAEVRGIIEVVRAVEYLRDVKNLRIELAGSFSPASIQKTLESLSGWRAVVYHGWVTREQLAHILGSVRAGLVLHHPIPNEVHAQPIKLFEYMSAGIPVIASDFPLWRRIIDGERCGLLVDPLNPTAIADAMRWVLDHPVEAEAMGQRGQKAVEQIYNWETESVKLINLYKKLLS